MSGSAWDLVTCTECGSVVESGGACATCGQRSDAGFVEPFGLIDREGRAYVWNPEGGFMRAPHGLGLLTPELSASLNEDGRRVA